jgi:hypothetical protein
MFLDGNVEVADKDFEFTTESLAILDQTHDIACKQLEMLGEGSMITGKYHVKKELKLKRMVARAANLIAKQGGDPLYSKMLFHYLKMKTFRAAIQKKYGLKAKAQVRVYLTRKHSPLHH